MSELIQYQRDDGIVTLTLNSPETRNPISDDDMIEALACGLVSRVVPDDQLLDEARALAQRIAVNPTQAVRMTKRLLWAGRSLRLNALDETPKKAPRGSGAKGVESLVPSRNQAMLLTRRSPRNSWSISPS